MGWKIIEIQKAERLRLFLNNLVIYREDNKITIPISDIDTLIIDNIEITLSVQLLNKLADFNVNVILCNNQHLPNVHLIPISGNYNSLKILNAQLSWNHVFKAKLWKAIIQQKILNQISTLNHFEPNKRIIYEMQTLYKNVKEYDVTNREGHASKIYWHTLYGLDFNRRDDENIINKYLNYGYSILRSYFARSIVKKGLDPRISIFHKSFHNHFALASDLMEVFRIIIDNEVLKIVKIEKMKNPWFESKQKLIECFNNKILLNEKEQFINNAIDIFIDSIVNEQKIPDLIFPIYYEQ